jgi:hypothetical protein
MAATLQAAKCSVTRRQPSSSADPCRSHRQGPGLQVQLLAQPPEVALPRQQEQRYKCELFFGNSLIGVCSFNQCSPTEEGSAWSSQWAVFR